MPSRKISLPVPHSPAEGLLLLDGLLTTSPLQSTFIVIVLLLALLSTAPPSCDAQTPPLPAKAVGDPGERPQVQSVEALASELADSILRSNNKTVLVLDLAGPDVDYATLGTFLADQISDALTRTPKLKTIDRLGIPGTLWSLKLSEKDLGNWENARKVGKRLGAKAVIRGTFSREHGTLAIHLTASALSEKEEIVGTAAGTVTLTQEMNSRLPERLDLQSLLHVFRPGKDGVSFPKCTHCPNPTYSDQARADKLQGRVVLLVTVTAEGRTANLVVLRRAGYGLDEQAIETVRQWRFVPAHGPDGKPVAARIPIEITFRLF